MRQYILQDFLPLMRNAVVATIDADGHPYQRPAGVYYDGESYYFQAAVDAQELRNLRRDPRLSICFAEPGDRGGHVIVRGSVVEQRVRGSHGIFVRIAPERN